MKTPSTCPECGTVWRNNETCLDHIYQMLYWEAEHPGYGEVHHLMVLSYHLQHPSLYSPEGLEEAKSLLRKLLEDGATPLQIRKVNQAKVDSGKRSWKIKGTRRSHGTYKIPVQWKMTAADVVDTGASAYCENVRKWSRSTLESFKETEDC